MRDPGPTQCEIGGQHQVVQADLVEADLDRGAHVGERELQGRAGEIEQEIRRRREATPVGRIDHTLKILAVTEGLAPHAVEPGRVESLDTHADAPMAHAGGSEDVEQGLVPEQEVLGHALDRELTVAEIEGRCEGGAEPLEWSAA